MSPIKRSIMIAGHATSVSLEPVFWEALRRGAKAEGPCPLNALVAGIDAARARSPQSYQPHVRDPGLGSAGGGWGGPVRARRGVGGRFPLSSPP